MDSAPTLAGAVHPQEVVTVKSAIPLILLAVLLLGMLLLTRRNRERAGREQTRQRERIHFGSEVMTTSGLYGTVTRVNDDDSVQLAIAPGVEVRWALAALRDVETLPNQYRNQAEADQTDAAERDDPPDDHPSR
jgi:preprotein translocase subunit YajC